MKKCAAILLSFFWFVPLIAPHTTSEGVMVAVIIPVEADISPLQPLWEAVCVVESSNNYHALNTLEMAYGIAQIRQIRLDDYNQRTGEHLGLLQE